jgi:hypothetical protein
MGAGAHRGDYDIAFYEARIGETLEASTVAAATPVFLNSDADGPLQPARWLIQVTAVSGAGVAVWVGLSAFDKGDSPSSVAGAGPQRIPLSRAALVFIETHVLAGVDDRVTLETIGGSATITATRVSTVTPKAQR